MQECQKQLNILKAQKEEYEVKINELDNAFYNKESNYDILTKYLDEANENINKLTSDNKNLKKDIEIINSELYEYENMNKNLITINNNLKDEIQMSIYKYNEETTISNNKIESLYDFKSKEINFSKTLNLKLKDNELEVKILKKQLEEIEESNKIDKEI